MKNVRNISNYHECPIRTNVLDDIQSKVLFDIKKKYLTRTKSINTIFIRLLFESSLIKLLKQ